MENYLLDVKQGKIKTFKGKILYYACKLLRVWKTEEQLDEFLTKIYTKKYKKV